MRRILHFLLFLFLLPYRSYAQSGPNDLSYYLKQLPPQLIATCNTAQNIREMSQEEKDAVLITNLARVNPQLFLKVFLHDYVKNSDYLTPSNPYVLSLQRKLETMEPLKPLKVEKVLNEQALTHALYSQRTGRTGHDNFEKRCDVIRLKLKHHLIGENCGYGWNSALDFVMDLMIDEGIEGVGHRRNMLSPAFTSIGVSVQPFGEDGQCLIQMFSAP